MRESLHKILKASHIIPHLFWILRHCMLCRRTIIRTVGLLFAILASYKSNFGYKQCVYSFHAQFSFIIIIQFTVILLLTKVQTDSHSHIVFYRNSHVMRLREFESETVRINLLKVCFIISQILPKEIPNCKRKSLN